MGLLLACACASKGPPAQDATTTTMQPPAATRVQATSMSTPAPARAQSETVGNARLASTPQVMSADKGSKQGVTEMQASDRSDPQLAARRAELRGHLAQVATVKEDARGVVVSLPAELLFERGRFEISPVARPKLDALAETLAPGSDPITIYGCADEPGRRGASKTLAMSRAAAVRDYLLRRGVRPDLIVAVGKTTDEPAGSSSEARPAQRHLEIAVHPVSTAAR